MKKILLLLGVVVVIACIGLTGCDSDDADDVDDDAVQATESTTAQATESTAPQPVDSDLGEYGYDGTDPVIAEVYEYLADEIADQYGVDDDEGIISVPVVSVIDDSEGANGEHVVKGAYWIYNYKIEGDTLKCVSGGSHPGAMHIVRDDDGNEYEVVSFDAVKDGGEFDPSAKEIFGDKYEEFTKVNSDDKAQEELRGATLANYVKSHGLQVTKYQDEGWDPIELKL